MADYSWSKWDNAFICLSCHSSAMIDHEPDYCPFCGDKLE